MTLSDRAGFTKKPSRQAVLPTENGLSIYLRLDDVYSYLAVQQLSQLDEILSDELKPLKIIISIRLLNLQIA